MSEPIAEENLDTPEALEEALAAGRRLFGGPITFLLSAPQIRFLPDAVCPEVAFAGRSNVGKSSLINALTNRSGLARTSGTPGRTQELNFFDVGDPAEPILRLVDMPGYGYAEAPRDLVAAWQGLIKTYLRGRPNLKRVLVLIDSRHGIKPPDEPIFELLDKSAVSYQIVLTKVDKLNATETRKVFEKTLMQMKRHVACHPEIIATSAAKAGGIETLRAAIAALL